MLLYGKEVANKLNEETIIKVENMYDQSIVPTLAILRIGENSSDIAYEKAAAKKANDLGIKVEHFICKADIEEDDVITIVNSINNDKSIHGVLALRPFPKHIDDNKVRNALLPSKDLDGISDESLLGVFADTNIGFPPCTAKAVMEILYHYNIPIMSKKVVIIGRSLVIGKPVAMMLLRENANITICHSKTSKEDLHGECKCADIIVCAAGQINNIDYSYIKQGATVIDVGINFDDDGKMTGDLKVEDIDTENVNITPVPGGVGTVTTSVLMKHLIESIKTEA